MSPHSSTLIVELTERGSVMEITAASLFFKHVQSLLSSVQQSEAVALHRPVKWGLRRASKGSPLQAEIVAADGFQDVGDAAMRAMLDGLVSLQHDREPSWKSRHALKSARRLVQLLKRPDVAGMTISYGETLVRPTLSINTKIDELLNEHSPEFDTENTVLIGRLDDALLHDSKTFVLYDEVDGHSVKLHVSGPQTGLAKKLLEKRVIVTGRVTWNRESGRAVSVAVSDIEEFGTGVDGPVVMPPSINITDGASSEDFARRLRDDE